MCELGTINSSFCLAHVSCSKTFFCEGEVVKKCCLTRWSVFLYVYYILENDHLPSISLDSFEVFFSQDFRCKEQHDFQRMLVIFYHSIREFFYKMKDKISLPELIFRLLPRILYYE